VVAVDFVAIFLYNVTIGKLSRKEKLIRKFLDCPGSLKFRQIELVLLWFGFEKIDAKGSHVRFKHCVCNVELSIPVHGGDCKMYYKIKISKLLKINFYE
jgi:predicted RNA binding protein YcfA (HicA-like mRNA interferase family)